MPCRVAGLLGPGTNVSTSARNYKESCLDHRPAYRRNFPDKCPDGNGGAFIRVEIENG